jgi:hypothetical protein
MPTESAVPVNWVVVSKLARMAKLVLWSVRCGRYLVLFVLLAASGCVVDEVPPQPSVSLMDTSGAGDAALNEGGAVDTTAADRVYTDVPDTIEPEPTGPLPPTWWQCRMGLTAGQLGPAEKARCDRHHTHAPASRRYGIRWVFLEQVASPEAWVAERLAIANTLYAPAGFHFETDSIVQLPEATLKDAVVAPNPTLGSLIGDVALHLELDALEPADILVQLQERLLEVGVSDLAVAGLTLDAAIPSRVFFGMMARARPEVIHVMVMASVGGAAGMSSPPGYLPNGLNTSLVFLHALEDLSPVVLPHELGHFFGLRHPQGDSELNVYELPVAFSDGVEEPFMVNHMTALGNWLGPSLEGPLGEPFVAYSLPFGEMMLAEGLRIAILEVWLLWRYSFRYGASGPEAFTSVADYLDWGASGGTAYRKNVAWTSATGPGGNCGWDVSVEKIRCLVGEPPTAVDGDDPFLDGSIVLNGGKTANIMTYIGKLLDVSFENPMVAFTPDQMEVLRVGANTPLRQLLRNLELK